jgi:hypothetical protein
MSLISPDPGDRGEPDVKIGRTGGSAVGERRLLRDGLQVLARGALICPACALPVSPAPRVAPRGRLQCAFCEHAGPAVGFLAEDVRDTVANQVILVARTAAS